MRVAVGTANVAKKVGPFRTASLRKFKVRTTCADSSGWVYAEAKAADVTAPTNNGVVLKLEFTLSGDLKDCSVAG